MAWESRASAASFAPNPSDGWYNRAEGERSITPELDEKIIRLAIEKGLITNDALRLAEAEMTKEMGTLASDEWSPRIEFFIAKGILNDDTVEQLKSEILAKEPLDENGTQQTKQVSYETDSDKTRADSVLVTRKYIGSTFGRYENLQFLGEGGMAQVYRAHDPTLDRAVALKFLRSDNPKLAERLMIEARSQARIEHEHVCKVYEVGNISDTPYIAMQYIQGETLRSLFPKLGLDLKVALMKQVCEAIQAAHRAGLIHRDLKPANIMIEQNAEGQYIPYVMDFGVAREVDAAGVTTDGTVVGSAWYMPPEQARGEIARLDRRSDVYSLGATLYEILSGRLPFDTISFVETLVKVIHEDPVPLNQRDPNLPVDLVTIVAKCMEKEPSRRYDSARALADDLGRFLEGEPVSARPVGMAQRLYRKARKHKAVTLTILAASLLILTMTGILLHARWTAQRQIQFTREIASDVSNMEYIMRLACLRPLHDVAREKGQVRALMSHVQNRMKEAGPIADGPGSYAIGRGHLALNEIPEAREALDHAWSSGFRPPEAAYALGMVYGKLYADELVRVVRIGNAEQRAIQLKKIQADYLAPAQDYLQKGASAELDSSDYVRALLLFFEDKEDKRKEALETAEAGRKQHPEIYEFDLLEAEIYKYEAGRANQKGDYDEAQRNFDLAAGKYKSAADYARSDSRAYSGLCELGSDLVEMKLYGEGGDLAPLIQKGLDSCRTAVASDSENADNYVGECYIYRYLGESQIDSGQDAKEALDHAINSGQTAVRLDPKNGLAHAALATAALYQADSEISKGGDPQSYLELSIREANLAIPLLIRRATAYNILANAYADLGEYLMRNGKDPLATFQSAVNAYGEAIKINPKYSGSYNNVASVYRDMAKFDLWHGTDPSPLLHKALDNTALATHYKPNDAYPITEAGRCYNELASFTLDSGKDPAGFIQKALENFAAAMKINAEYIEAPLNLAATHRLSGEYAMLTEHDPGEFQRNGETAISQAMKLNANNADVFYESALIHTQRAEFAVMSGKNPDDALALAKTDINHALQIDSTYGPAYLLRITIAAMQTRRQIASAHPVPDKDVAKDMAAATQYSSADPDAYRAMADYYAAVAEAAIASRQSPAEPIRSGLDNANKALQMRANWGEAHAIRAVIYLQAARSTDGAARKESAKQAAESMAKAFELDPLLRKRFQSYAQQIDAL